MIEYENVHKEYKTNGKTVVALEDVSLRIGAGEFVFLVGPSGAGKSTCLYMALRDLLPSEGRVRVNGADLAKMRPKEVPLHRRGIGFVFQDFRLLPQHSVFNNVAFAMRVIGAPNRQIRKRVPEVLDMVGVLDKANQLPYQLSGGEQQRVGLARALANSPSLILADEPTGNLDPATSEELMDLLLHINRMGTTVVVATHDRACVDRLKRRVVVLKKGRVVADRPRGVYRI